MPILLDLAGLTPNHKSRPMGKRSASMSKLTYGIYMTLGIAVGALVGSGLG